jgi:hypothetical protein
MPGDEGGEDARRAALVIDAGNTALDRLHRLVLPFMLRRTKQASLY